LNQTELIVQLQQGDNQAFKRLVDEWQDMVYNTALGIVQKEEDADDITQDVFIQVYQSVSSFKGESKFSTWLYRIVISKALDHVKKKKRKKRFAFKAMQQLPDNQRIAFTLHKLEAQKHQDIAAIMNLSVTATESLIARAKGNLRKTLKQYYEENNF
jgi:RNA polymerase sigma-70 factor (ECF subfamily)